MNGAVSTMIMYLQDKSQFYMIISILGLPSTHGPEIILKALAT